MLDALQSDLRVAVASDSQDDGTGTKDRLREGALQFNIRDAVKEQFIKDFGLDEKINYNGLVR